MKKMMYNPGTVIGHWTIISEAPSLQSGSARWQCRCVCGTIKPVLSGKLARGASLSCGCVRNAALGTRRWTGHGEVSGSMWKSILRGAVHRSIHVSITIEDVWRLFLAQERKCALTGWEIKLPHGQKRIGTASLDRIDNTIGYVVGNIQWVHKDINIMKMSHTQARFIELCAAVTAHAEQSA